MLNRLRTRWRPETFQGAGRTSRYFEGWYYKIVDEDEKNVMAIIPGISLGDSSAHAFVQVLDGTRSRYHYHRYRIEEFDYSEDEFCIQVGPNRFREDMIQLEIGRESQELRGSLRFHGIRPWPKGILSPGAMGVLGFVPGIPCYHHIISLGHGIEGQLAADNRAIDFEGGRGYTEKSWGSSFPSAWIWIQSNHFDDPDDCLILATARMKVHARTVQGLTCALMSGDRLYRFCTWSGGRLTRLAIDRDLVTLSLENPEHRIDIEAALSTATEMRVPRMGEMTGKVLESLSSRIVVTLRERDDGEVLLEDEGRCAGVEIGGDAGEMVADLG